MHYLQSPAWAAFHTALGNKTFIRSGEGWHYLAILDSEASPVCTAPTAPRLRTSIHSAWHWNH